MGDPVLTCTGWLACESNSLYLKRSWERRVCDLKESSEFFFLGWRNHNHLTEATHLPIYIQYEFSASHFRSI